MAPKRPLLLYSAYTLLAYRVNQQFYGGLHYAWCSPYFSAEKVDLTFSMPPSSTPCDICLTLRAEIKRGDHHSAKIQSVKDGIRRGANWRFGKGDISEDQRKAIEYMVSVSGLEEFSPLLFVIPFAAVAKEARLAPVARRAHPASPEYIIESLPRKKFDVLEWHW